MTLSAEIVRPGDLAPRDRALWAGLCDEVPAYRSPLLAPEFAECVARLRPDAKVAVLKRAGSTVGFFAHHRRPNGYARPIGAPFSDYHGVIAPPEAAIQLPAALSAAGLRSFRHTGLIGSSGGDVVSSTEGYGVDLTGISPEEHLENLRRADPKRFKNWRRLWHKLEREQPDISFGPEEAPEALARVVGWKRTQLRRSGLHDVLQPAWVQRMMTGLLARPDDGFGGMLLVLRIAGRPIAGHFGLRRGTVFHPWVAAFDPEFARYSPGVLFMLRAISAMPELNLELYDLSAGSDHYKRPFANSRTIARTGLTYAADAERTRPAFAGLGPLSQRFSKRLEHIASVEPSLGGRVRGLLTAVKDAPKRLGDAAPDVS